MFDLTGKTALVTGASGGIGAAVASVLHGQGATVGLVGTRVTVLEAVAAALGDRAHVLRCDLADPTAVDALPKQAAAAMGITRGYDATLWISIGLSCSRAWIPIRIKVISCIA